jgi:hypothetical protein
LINQIHLALVKAICNDIETSATQGTIAQQENESSMLIGLINSIIKNDPNKDQIWTEMIRILVLHMDDQDNGDLDTEGLDPYIAQLLKRVGALTPSTYTYFLTYKEKVDLLLYLVDAIHDLDKFRQFLNKRLEEKSTLFKQKTDLHSEIKKIE